MSISEELRASILRYHHVEKWKVGTISRQLQVHHSTIKRVLSETGVSKEKLLVKGSMIDPFLPFILSTLERFPRLRASRLHDMVKERGYAGGRDHFRHLIACYRPRPVAQAYLRLRTLPGEQAQVDWGQFGHIMIGKAKRPLMAFVMVLSFSRKIFLHFYLNQRIENFLRGHEAAFNAFGGVPRVVLYDNLKSCVLERQGDAIRFNPRMLGFAAHYRYEARPVAVYRGNEKGRVERVIRYARDNFFAARTFKDVNDLNQQARVWCEQTDGRPCPEDRTKSVNELFDQEKPSLIALPDNPYTVDEMETVSIPKTPYARFDLNDYSVPHDQCRKTLTIHATLEKVTILDGTTVKALHPRSYDKGAQIECESHIATLIAHKKQASHHRGQDRLSHAIDCAQTFLNAAAARGYPLRSTTKQLIDLLDDYGTSWLEFAMKEALDKDVPHPNAVRQSLQRLLDKHQQLPTVTQTHSREPRANEVVIKPHSLEHYTLSEEK